MYLTMNGLSESIRKRIKEANIRFQDSLNAIKEAANDSFVNLRDVPPYSREQYAADNMASYMSLAEHFKKSRFDVAKMRHFGMSESDIASSHSNVMTQDKENTLPAAIKGGPERLGELFPPSPISHSEDSSVEYGWQVGIYVGCNIQLDMPPKVPGKTRNFNTIGCETTGYKTPAAAFYDALDYARQIIEQNPGFTFTTTCKVGYGVLDIVNNEGKPILNICMTFERLQELAKNKDDKPKAAPGQAMLRPEYIPTIGYESPKEYGDDGGIGLEM